MRYFVRFYKKKKNEEEEGEEEEGEEEEEEEWLIFKIDNWWNKRGGFYLLTWKDIKNPTS